VIKQLIYRQKLKEQQFLFFANGANISEKVAAFYKNDVKINFTEESEC